MNSDFGETMKYDFGTFSHIDFEREEEDEAGTNPFFEEKSERYALASHEEEFIK